MLFVYRYMRTIYLDSMYKTFLPTCTDLNDMDLPTLIINMACLVHLLVVCGVEFREYITDRALLILLLVAIFLICTSMSLLLILNSISMLYGILMSCASLFLLLKDMHSRMMMLLEEPKRIVIRGEISRSMMSTVEVFIDKLRQYGLPIEVLGEADALVESMCRTLLSVLSTLLDTGHRPSKIVVQTFMMTTATVYDNDGSRLISISYTPSEIEMDVNTDKLSREVIDKILQQLRNLIPIGNKVRLKTEKK